MNNEHAPIAPSSLAMTVECPGSVTLQAQVPEEPETEEAAEGTAAHWIALKYAQGQGAQFPVGAKFHIKGREWTVDLDMVTGAMMYAQAVGGHHSELRLEDPVGIPRIHVDKCYGTPDAWRFLTHDPKAKLLRVVDYKYGHRFVEVYDNYQLAAYASGIMHRLGLTDNDPELFLELTLVQPRVYHKEGAVRSWRGPADMLRAVLNIARAAASEALGPNPRTRTNEHCLDCRARHVCRTLQFAAQTFIDFSGTPEKVELPPEAMGQEMVLIEEAIDRLKARYTGLAAHAEVYMRAGTPIAFHHMEAGQSRRIYREDVTLDELVGLGDLLGIELRKKQTLKETLVTPTQAVQLGIDESVMSEYSHRPPAALKLARDNSMSARKVFNK